MVRKRKKKHNKNYPRCCGRPMYTEMVKDGKTFKSATYCKVCGRVV